jgi:hypothetical protein
MICIVEWKWRNVWEESESCTAQICGIVVFEYVLLNGNGGMNGKRVNLHCTDMWNRCV